MTYEVKKDNHPINKNKEWYIRAAKPSCYLTNNMTLKEVKTVVKALRDLGNTVLGDL